MSIGKSAAKFVSDGMATDSRKFDQMGIDQSSEEAARYYTRWIREDLTGIFHMIHQLHEYARLHALLFVAIAVPLWIIALR